MRLETMTIRVDVKYFVCHDFILSNVMLKYKKFTSFDGAFQILI